MSYPDNMTYSRGPYAPQLRALTTDEIETLRRLERAKELALSGRSAMAAMAPTYTAFGPEHCGAYYDDMIRDLQWNIDEIEAAPQTELEDQL